ncbi:DHS-like NAD/FAD-binding domain-containing protein [Rhizodiscina lignyota]|uniref:protein acetyllysine N-acetyltransferase n=1 Tax=Rhizodiscina lignyota TaxID=1504668 RepID=A0A9P4ILP9_9PEZI|nr:DHS-like NAD/FAD-binding domain-containing protein [Rhizodiscina lignyota]
MDLTAPKIAEREHFDPLEVVDQLATDLADQIKSSKHFIAFTGAGVSTSAGIPDFRGPEGAWTLRAQGRELNFKSSTTLQAIPSPTHMALVELQNRGILKYLVSQNCDGLHRRSGILPDRISELHGNSNREYCKDCGKEFIRDFRAVSTYEKSIKDHRTGRKCTRCGSALHDTIINFGEDLPERAFRLAYDNAKKADLCLVLGSSLTVTPANTIPEVVGQRKKAKLAICNLQRTPLDDNAHLLIHTRTDDLMIRVMDKLDIPIPIFILRRRLAVEVESQAADRHQLKVYGVDVDGTPVSFLRSVKLEHSRRVARSEPFVISIRDSLDHGPLLKLELEFMGHYGEPNVAIAHEFNGEANRQCLYLLEYNHQNGEWKTSKQDGQAWEPR